MSKQEVVEAFLEGRIDRREFVRRLTVVGVSAGAAIAYAQTLGTPTAAASRGRSGHGYATRLQDDYEQDTDGDGYSDDEERDCGSDPYDANSVCKDDDGAPVTKLPDTGTSSQIGGSKWLAPLAIAGAGTAFVARKLRELSSTQS